MKHSDNFCLNEIVVEIKKINKNLEKIANKDFTISTNNYKTESIGNYLDTNKIKEQMNTILCKQNKDGRVDKNIILD